MGDAAIDGEDAAIERTHENREMTLVFAVSYGGRAEIVDAAQRIARDAEDGKLDVNQLDEKIFASYLYAPDLPDPDLLIRTSGESRLSGFLLWQSAYAEFVFVDVNWPAFRHVDFLRALRDYAGRNRRFGK